MSKSNPPDDARDEPAALNTITDQRVQPVTVQEVQPTADEAESRAGNERLEAQSLAGGSLDLNALRLPQNFNQMAGVRKVLQTVPVRKPHRQEWVWVRPDEGWRLATAIVENHDDHEVYLVLPNMLETLLAEWVPCLLVTTQTRGGTVFLWPVRLPNDDKRPNAWNQSALEIVQGHAGRWIRVASNMELGAYELSLPQGEIPPPVWPDVDFQTLVNLAFKGKIIGSPNHPVVKRLRGLGA
ncbi:MAG: hypothetical protein ABSA67_17305 [Candidatus Brocadiia bacterium]